MDIIAEHIEGDSSGILLKGHQSTNRQPIHIILLIDTSGSMECDNKLISVKRSIQCMLDLLTSSDRISLITFDTDSTTILKQVIPDRNTIEYAINNLKTNGSTNLSAGLLEVRDCVEDIDISNGRKQGLVILTDGVVNQGVTNLASLHAIVSSIQINSLSVSTIGYGLTHNAELLREIATGACGSYNIVNNLENVATVFGDILGGLMSIIMQKIEIHLPLGSIVKTAFRITTTPTSMIVHIGDLYSESEQSLVFILPQETSKVRITGTNILTLERSDIECNFIIPIDSNIALMMAEIRYEVCKLLKEVVSYTASMLRINNNLLKNKIQNMVEYINSIVRLNDNPLKSMLIHDLNDAMLRVDSSNDYLRSPLSQAVAYWGLQRGVHYINESVSISSADEPSSVEYFSNPVQRGLSRAMRDLSQQ